MYVDLGDGARAAACHRLPRSAMARTVLFGRDVRHAVTAAVLLAASAVRAQPGLTPPATTGADGGALPFIRDDGGTFVDARVALIAAGVEELSLTGQALDVRAQVLLNPTAGVYGTIGGERAHTVVQDQPTPSMSTAYGLRQAEVGGFLRLRGDWGGALTLSGGAVLPIVHDPMTPFVEVAEPPDGVRGYPDASIRAGATASYRREGFVAAAHLGGALMPSWRDPIKIDFAGAVGYDAPALSIVFGFGAYHAPGDTPFDAQTTLSFGLDVGHRFGRVQTWLGGRAGHGPLFDVDAALEGGVRWDF